MLVETRTGYFNGIQKLYKFPNGYGASVLKSDLCLGKEKGLEELAVIQWNGDDWDICYDTPITDRVLGRLNPQEVEELLKQIEALP